ncbi:probable E3 ubiquitin-protein ligase makorin-1 isoform X1 [Lethenteron reissneri]|uniref:probable E3 ubiquitin-protein ligase makorin-1 isoform X1 n=2 Tax=Lethenteron reissneri TaxID=7753 RepID=UPI002AB7C620|nr:probable E3 ubiquitin-protein ligase makorin-1 isoform X1 [Lethenteron reissneri]
MAEAGRTAAWKGEVTCRYFLHGVCREGRNCPYSHDLSTSKPAMSCKFYQRGRCVYGDGCRYDHVKPPAPSKQQHAAPPSAAKAPPRPVPLTSDCGAAPSKLTPLSRAKQGSETGGATAAGKHGLNHPLGKAGGAADWVNAAEFVPGQPYNGREVPSSYLAAAQEGLPPQEEPVPPPAPAGASQQLCPYAAVGECRYGDHCVYLHGDVCDMCGLQVLHPSDSEQRTQHHRACVSAHEKDMEAAFAVQRSSGVVCGICMEVVFEKARASERRFGILSSCSHAYCLSCIRKWRRTKQLENKVIKSCPECRVTSDFVIPSEYWIDCKEEKDKLIQSYKDAMGQKACRYFDQGRGSCPFGVKCFYLHAYPDGRKEDKARARKQHGQEGHVRFQSSIRLWDFIEERESRAALLDSDDDLIFSDLSDLLFMLLAGDADFATDSDDDSDLFDDSDPLDDDDEFFL